MKNFVIAALVIAVLGLGGWVAYDKLATKSDSSSSSSSSSSSASGTTATNSATTLDLSNKGLTKVGSDVYNKTGTTVLILSNNNLTSLPSEMGKMTKLQVLKLDHNRLEGSLIGEIRKMPLVTLDASNNNMTGVPAEIGQLNKLETLDYSNNKIDTLPNEIYNLKQLKTLNLTGNPISADKVSKLKSELPSTNIIIQLVIYLVLLVHDLRCSCARPVNILCYGMGNTVGFDSRVFLVGNRTSPGS